MDEKNLDIATMDEYLAQFPPEVGGNPSVLRQAMRDAAGFYPAPAGIEAFEERLSAYKTSKGAVQLPLDKPLPFDLIREIVRFRAAGNTAKAVKKCLR